MQEAQRIGPSPLVESPMQEAQRIGPSPVVE